MCNQIMVAIILLLLFRQGVHDAFTWVDLRMKWTVRRTTSCTLCEKKRLTSVTFQYFHASDRSTRRCAKFCHLKLIHSRETDQTVRLSLDLSCMGPMKSTVLVIFRGPLQWRKDETGNNITVEINQVIPIRFVATSFGFEPTPTSKTIISGFPYLWIWKLPPNAHFHNTHVRYTGSKKTTSNYPGAIWNDLSNPNRCQLSSAQAPVDLWYYYCNLTNID